MLRVLCCVFLMCVVAGHQQHHCDDTTPPDNPGGPVTIALSGEFRGAYNVTRLGRRFESYRGIKYAQPPVGELRFQPPKAIYRHETPVDASKDGPACPQPTVPNYYVDEDCLTINVYTPLKKDRKGPLPVVFFIHAGGFYSMTGRSDLAGANYLLDKDIVLVTINYRLGSLGFLSTGDQMAPGNNGFKDQVVALRWVQRNIAAFGGDPNSVTIAGCSAGSISVMLHMISPMSKGLFHRGISISGSPVTKVMSPTDLMKLAVRQAQLLNCPAENSTVIVECLKTKSWKELGNSLLGFYEFGYDPILLWEAVVEKDFGQERFLPLDPMDAIRQGMMHDVPYIISQTEDEFFRMAYTILRNETLLKQMNEEWDRVAPISFVLPSENRAVAVAQLRLSYLQDQQMKNDAQSADSLGRLYSDAIMAFPVNRLVNLMCRHSLQPVWYYEFSYIGNHSHYEDPKTGKPIRAAHHDDLIYLFSLPYRFPEIGVFGPDARVVDLMLDIWYNFAKYGDPNPQDGLEGIKWPAVKPENRTYLRIGDQLSLHRNLFEERLQVWEQLYPIQY